MIFINSKLKVSDNVGARVGKCIKLSKKIKYGSIGNLILVSAINTVFKKRIKKGELLLAVIIRTKKNYKRNYGNIFISFGDNSSVVVDKKGEPNATRMFGPIVRDIVIKYKRVVAMAEYVL
jgi:large subunit ribosomal protein L14